MRDDIIFTIKDQSGACKEVKIVPETVASVNGRMDLSGAFYLYNLVPKGLDDRMSKEDTNIFIVYAGTLRFTSEALTNYRYEGRIFSQPEVLHLVELIRDNSPEWAEN